MKDVAYKFGLPQLFIFESLALADHTSQLATAKPLVEFFPCGTIPQKV
jgi:hypothetical protein